MFADTLNRNPLAANVPPAAGDVDLAADLAWQASLFGSDPPDVDEDFRGLERHRLDEASWLDYVPRWLRGSDEVFAELVARTEWRQRRVVMYDRVLDEPRLTWWWSEPDDVAALPLPVLDRMRRVLSDRYGHHFDSVGLNLYRDGTDSVAWHGDRIRLSQVDPLVLIVSVGAPRPFLVRPRGGGSSQAWLLGHGDLLVMGGAVQHDWEHTVPKVASAGPRLSVTYRHAAPAASDIVSSRPVDTLGRGRRGRARSSTSRNEVIDKPWHDADGVRVREHPAEIEAP
jgi:alkylated DNA repair dioxygenase AlkB